jgi:glutamine amidotransferase
MPKAKITLIDLGYGNNKSIINALKYIEVDTVVTNKAKKILNSDMLILPGVGAFNTGVEYLEKLNLIEAIKETTLIKKKKILGICLGMHLMGKSSEEAKKKEGLNFFDIKFKKFRQKISIPHMGFNEIFSKNFSLTRNMQNCFFYFAHSFKASVNENKKYKTLICHHGENFIAGIEKDNFFGVQFHPEKSQTSGLKILKNFYKL